MELFTSFENIFDKIILKDTNKSINDTFVNNARYSTIDDLQLNTKNNKILSGGSKLKQPFGESTDYEITGIQKIDSFRKLSVKKQQDEFFDKCKEKLREYEGKEVLFVNSMLSQILKNHKIQHKSNTKLVPILYNKNLTSNSNLYLVQDLLNYVIPIKTKTDIYEIYANAQKKDPKKDYLQLGYHESTMYSKIEHFGLENRKYNKCTNNYIELKIVVVPQEFINFIPRGNTQTTDLINLGLSIAYEWTFIGQLKHQVNAFLFSKQI